MQIATSPQRLLAEFENMTSGLGALSWVLCGEPWGLDSVQSRQLL